MPHDSNAVARTPDPDAKPGWKLRLEARLGILDPIQVVVFRSFGTPDLLHVRGRVIEQKGIVGTTESSTLWQNVLNTLRRLDSDEIPGARLRARFGGRSWETTSDAEGYFVFNADPPEPIAPGWHEVEIDLLETIGEPAERTVRARVLVPAPDAEFAVVSDVDDTIIRSRSTNVLQEMAIVFGNGARDRSPFRGVPAFYRALRRGSDDRGDNPVFYVSRSGWNLYDLLDEFMEFNDIPRGPLFLSDLRILESRSDVLGNQHEKFDSIDMLMRTYPGLPFILVGDSGMKDPELYRQVAKVHPGRVAAVYIHDVSGPGRDREVDEIARALQADGVPLVRAEEAMEAAEHAAGHGFISREGLDEVRREVERVRREGRGDAPD